jgi:hypothetical protein
MVVAGVASLAPSATMLGLTCHPRTIVDGPAIALQEPLIRWIG